MHIPRARESYIVNGEWQALKPALNPLVHLLRLRFERQAQLVEGRTRG